MKNWIERFSDPEVSYRPHPFWSWNDKLEEGELRRQIRDMKESGQGGFFMHARDGLITPYMKEEWFDLIRACTDEAEKCGLEAWAYDELGWPSGSAGGDIPAMGDAYKMRWLRLREYDGKTEGDFIAYYAVRENGEFRRIRTASEKLCDGERVMYAASFCDDSYFDILDPQVVRAFIDHTYEGYLKECGGDFKKSSLCGFFTDEPQYAMCRNPWSLVLPALFKSEYGYDIADVIPALFLGRDGHEDVRFDFWSLVSRLFTESFGKQIGDWCRAHDCRLTGHIMLEDNMLCQIHSTAGTMPIYEHFDIPGVDWLGRRPAYKKGSSSITNPVLPLQVGSVAAQTGKKQVITESFAIAGWEMTFADMRYLVEWQFLGGVNLVCQHLAAYTIRERRKADYPPSMFHQSPWFRDYNTFADTESRLGKILAEGHDATDILLVHPMHSVWLKYTNENMNGEQAFDTEFALLAAHLSTAHILYHLGDETIMRRHGSVDGTSFKVGECTYKTVLLPSLYGLDRSTYELLLKFKNNGGHLVALGRRAEFIDGRRAEEELSALYDGIDTLDLSDSDTYLERIRRYFVDRGLTDVSVMSRSGEEECIQLCRREYPEDGVTAYFFLNTDPEFAHNVSIELPGRDALELRVDTMEFVRHPSDVRADRVVLDVNFAPMESHLILVGDDLPEGELVLGARDSEEIKLFTGAGRTTHWRLGKESDPNCCTLEYCRVNDGESLSESMHSFHANRRVCDLTKRGVSPSLHYSFVINDKTDISRLSDMRVVCEEAQPYRLSINGTEVSALDGEWWLDHAFSVHAIGDFIKHGENEIVISDFCSEIDGKLCANSEFGNIYLTGNFGVFFDTEPVHCSRRGIAAGKDFYLSDRPTEFAGGELVTQGHPFFAGHIVLEREITVSDASRPHHITLAKPYAACASLIVNGKKGRLLAWGELSEDVTDRLHDGVNTVGVELTVGNRNLLGPFHLKEAECGGCGPSDFAPFEPSKWCYRFGFEKSGLSD